MKQPKQVTSLLIHQIKKPYNNHPQINTKDSNDNLLIDLISDLKAQSNLSIKPQFKDRRTYRAYRNKYQKDKNKLCSISISSENTSHSLNSSQNYSGPYKNENSSINYSHNLPEKFIFFEDEIDHKRHKFFKFNERDTKLGNSEKIIKKYDSKMELRVMECDNDVMTDDEQILSGKNQLLGWMKETFKEIKSKSGYLNDKLSKKLRFKKEKKGKH